jgi:hypothetical protein
MYFYVQFYMWFQLFWIRLNKLVAQPTFVTRAATETFHKVVVIGDGFAEGLGDYVMFGSVAGVTRMLRSYINGDPMVLLSKSHQLQSKIGI